MFPWENLLIGTCQNLRQYLRINTAVMLGKYRDKHHQENLASSEKDCMDGVFFQLA